MDTKNLRTAVAVTFVAIFPVAGALFTIVGLNA